MLNSFAHSDISYTGLRYNSLHSYSKKENIKTCRFTYIPKSRYKDSPIYEVYKKACYIMNTIRMTLKFVGEEESKLVR